ncbi:MAG: hypothetical protein IKI11_01420 [Neisseriaceae bacterium]|nr:hypothetical protein [Neisseriaceae bacterium]
MPFFVVGRLLRLYKRNGVATSDTHSRNDTSVSNKIANACLSARNDGCGFCMTFQAA